MPLSAYKILRGGTHSQLSQAVQLELSLPNRVLASEIFTRNGVMFQAVGTGTIDTGAVTAYSVLTSASEDTFAAAITNQLGTFQPLGTPVVNNGNFYTAMGIISPSSGNTGQPGRTPELRVGLGYIQWKYQDEFEWQNLVALSALTGSSIQLRTFNGYIQWKPTTETIWENMVSLNDLKGPANSLSIGTISTGAEGSQASATISGTAPNQTLSLTIPRGNTGPANSLSIGTVTTVASGQDASATITGDAPNQTLNLGIPQGLKGDVGPVNNLSIGTVSTLETGASATATITGTAPNQTLNLGIPTGPAGTNSVTEVITGTVTTAGTAVPLTFTKTYSAPPAVIPIPQWSGQQMVTGSAFSITKTGCNFTAMQSRSTLLLSSGPFENAAAGVTFRVLVIGN